MFHLMLLIPVIILFIYNILPIPAGILMAFQNFQPGKGFLKSGFAGLENFRKLWILPDTMPALRNTLIIAIWKIIGNLVIPVGFALMLNEVVAKPFKRIVQTITYLPYFLSCYYGRNSDKVSISRKCGDTSRVSEYSIDEAGNYFRTGLFPWNKCNVSGNNGRKRYLEKFRL